MGSFHSLLGTCEIMSSIDVLKDDVVGGFYAIFHSEKALMIQISKIIEQGLWHTIRTSANHDANNVFHRKGFLVLSFQVIERCISIRIGLKISQIFHRGVFASKESLSFYELLGDGFGGFAIRRIESLIIAIGAAPHSNTSVSIGASETCIDGNFLCLQSYFGKEPRTILSITSVHFISTNCNIEFAKLVFFTERYIKFKFFYCLLRKNI